MKKIIFYSLFALMLSTTHSWTLSCVERKEADIIIPRNELIVKARVLDMKTEMHIPFLQDANDADDVITFEVIDFYKAPNSMPRTFKAHMSRFYKTWGPDLQVGQIGEYLFDARKAGGWDYAGPGGCNYYSEKEWQTLRENAKANE